MEKYDADYADLQRECCWTCRNCGRRNSFEINRCSCGHSSVLYYISCELLENFSHHEVLRFPKSVVENPETHGFQQENMYGKEKGQNQDYAIKAKEILPDPDPDETRQVHLREYDYYFTAHWDKYPFRDLRHGLHDAPEYGLLAVGIVGGLVLASAGS